jgi:hypothetical protein
VAVVVVDFHLSHSCFVFDWVIFASTDEVSILPTKSWGVLLLAEERTLQYEMASVVVAAAVVVADRKDYKQGQDNMPLIFHGGFGGRPAVGPDDALGILASRQSVSPSRMLKWATANWEDVDLLLLLLGGCGGEIQMKKNLEAMRKSYLGDHDHGHDRGSKVDEGKEMRSHVRT